MCCDTLLGAEEPRLRDRAPAQPGSSRGPAGHPAGAAASARRQTCGTADRAAAAGGAGHLAPLAAAAAAAPARRRQERQRLRWLHVADTCCLPRRRWRALVCCLHSCLRLARRAPGCLELLQRRRHLRMCSRGTRVASATRHAERGAAAVMPCSPLVLVPSAPAPAAGWRRRQPPPASVAARAPCHAGASGAPAGC